MIPHPKQHYRLQIDSAKQDYQDGLITAAGLLFYTVGILRQPGHHVSMPVRDWLELTGLKERTFYGAKAKLIATGRLKERIIGTVELWMPDSNIVPFDDDSNGDICTTMQPDCTTMQRDCKILQEDCTTMQTDCNILQNQPPEPLLQKDFSVSSNRSDITNKSNKPIEAAEKTFDQIPKDLRTKLEELTILNGTAKDEKVLEAIRKHHISQAYSAAAHVEKTFESCNNPRGVFLFQLPRMAVEQLGSREKIFTAIDFRYTTDDLRRLYGAGWREAAAHFGIEIEEKNND